MIKLNKCTITIIITILFAFLADWPTFILLGLIASIITSYMYKEQIKISLKNKIKEKKSVLSDVNFDAVNKPSPTKKILTRIILLSLIISILSGFLYNVTLSLMNQQNSPNRKYVRDIVNKTEEFTEVMGYFVPKINKVPIEEDYRYFPWSKVKLMQHIYSINWFLTIFQMLILSILLRFIYKPFYDLKNKHLPRNSINTKIINTVVANLILFILIINSYVSDLDINIHIFTAYIATLTTFGVSTVL